MNRLKRQLCAALKDQLTEKKRRAPDGGRLLLDAFTALSRARTYNRYGPNPITWEALAAWSAIMRVPIRPQHADIIMALDEVWLAHAARHAEEATGREKDGVKTLPPMSQHPISAALLDAMMG